VQSRLSRDCTGLVEMNAIEIKNVSFTYDNKHDVLDGISLDIGEREIIALVGPSGVGKSTLLKCINRLIKPTAGDIKVFGESIMTADRTKLRNIRTKIGVVFQQFNLFDRQKVIDNVLLGRLGYINTLRGLLFFPSLVYSESDYEMARNVLTEVGLGEYAEKRVFNLSGGQKQRVAIARALVQQPKIILADEPVSSLDPYLAKEILSLLVFVARKRKLTIVTSLHSLEIARSYSSRFVGMSKGKIVFEGTFKDLNQKMIDKIYDKEI